MRTDTNKRVSEPCWRCQHQQQWRRRRRRRRDWVTNDGALMCAQVLCVCVLYIIKIHIRTNHRQYRLWITAKHVCVCFNYNVYRLFWSTCLLFVANARRPMCFNTTRHVTCLVPHSWRHNTHILTKKNTRFSVGIRFSFKCVNNLF